MNTILFFTHYALLLLFGIMLSFAFAGVRLSQKKSQLTMGLTFVVCGLLQIGVFFAFEEQLVWMLYPLIVHLPLAAVLCMCFRKRIATAVAAICTAYLFCQPAKWLGLLIHTLTASSTVEYSARIIVLLGGGLLCLRYLTPYLSGIFQKDTRSVCIFGSVPLVNYLFDYTVGIYTDIWINHSRIAAEFLPFLLCITFIVFCVVYYREYEQKADAERKERLIRIQLEQQAAYIGAVRRSEQEIRLLRHDMRLVLSSLGVCLENGDYQKAAETIRTYTSHIEGTRVVRYCENDTVNYVLSDFAEKCRANEISFSCCVELGQLHVDEILFCSIIANALDNALNAQAELSSKEDRWIRLMLKTVDEKLLLSVKNPVGHPPVFADGLPVTTQKGHGYGTQSIRYVTEHLGGNCQFSVQDNQFVVRVVI